VQLLQRPVNRRAGHLQALGDLAGSGLRLVGWLLTSFAGFGRQARPWASTCAELARYRPVRSALRASSREIVEGLRPNRAAT
jgi:hypothetical protein